MDAIFYREWLPLPKAEFNVLAMIAEQGGSYSGNYTDMCRYLGVDPQSRNKILEGIQELNRQGVTIVYTSHYMEEVEQICIDVFMGMWNWARQYNNFGGFFMYTYYPWISKNTGLIHGGGRLYVLPDENGNVKWPRMAQLLNTVCEEFDKGKTPKEIELPDVGYDKGYIV